MTAVSLLAGCLLVAGIGLLLLPVVLGVSGARREPEGDIELSALVAAWGGLLGVRVRRLDPAWELAPTVVGRRLGLTIRLGGGAEVPDTATEKEADEAAVLRETEPPETEKQETIAGPGFVERLRSQLSLARALVRPLLRMIAALPSTLRLRQLRLSAVVGLDDAEATGRLYGIVQAITPAVPGRVCLSVTPDFTAAGVRGRGEARLHLYLGRLLVIVTRFGLTAARVWLAARLRAWWATRRRPVVS